MSHPKTPRAYGVVAEFDSSEAVLHAAETAHQAGYRRMDAHTPFPVHGLADAIGFEDNRVPWIIFVCAVFGGLAGYGLQYWVSVIGYPHNVGGRPLHSWVSFIPATFETTVLFAAFGAVFGMFALNGLPRPHHPIFETPNFERASVDRFFLCVKSSDAQYDAATVGELLRSEGALAVTEVME